MVDGHSILKNIMYRDDHVIIEIYIHIIIEIINI